MALAVVLVRTHSPGNLGSSARAAKCFGAELLLLDPRAERTHVDARAFASGAEDVLDAAAALSGWDALLATADRVYALTSLRARVARGLPPALRWSELRSREGGARIALVFGPERGGLTTEELRRCDARLSIPTDPALPTLNLAQAVAAALALAQPHRRTAGPAPATADDPAPARDVARLLDSFRETLAAAGYPGPGRSREVLAEMESLLRRGRPSVREVSLFLGAFASLRGGSR